MPFKKISDLNQFSSMPSKEVEIEFAKTLKNQSDWQRVNHVAKTVSDRLKKLVQKASESFEQRDREANAIVAGLASGVSVVLLGPPGTAKSALIRQIAFLCGLNSGSGNYFEYLLTNHTMPEELFGGVDLKSLSEGKLTRITKNKLPEAEIAFLDELFRGGSHILNTLLTIINEKRYDAGDGMRHVPLLGLIGASNLAPIDPDLEAFFDRFPVRVWLRSVLEPRNRFESENKKAGSNLIEYSIKSETNRLIQNWDSDGTKASMQSQQISCTNDLRFARTYLLFCLGTKGSPERRSQFEKLFRSIRERCKLSDRTFGQLWLFAAALDFIDNLDVTMQYPVSKGHIEVFKYVARSNRDLAFVNDRVDQITKGTQHTGEN